MSDIDYLSLGFSWSFSAVLLDEEGGSSRKGLLTSGSMHVYAALERAIVCGIAIRDGLPIPEGCSADIEAEDRNGDGKLDVCFSLDEKK